MTLRSTVHLARARAGLEPSSALPSVDPARPSIRRGGSDRLLSFREWYEPVEPLSAWLRTCDVHTGDRVLLLSETRMEWMQADLAVQAAGALSVPVYPTIPASQMEQILADSGARAAFVSRPELLEELVKAPSALGRLHTVVLMEAGARPIAIAPAGARAKGDPPGPAVWTWDEALVRGRTALSELASRLEGIRRGLGLEEPATLIYTSGTSGQPKGVVLTHGNLLADAESSARQVEVTDREVYLSYLPMSHVLERVVHLSMLWAGARIHYSEGLDRIAEEFRRVRPTLIVGVPRLYEKILLEAEEKARARGPRLQLFFRMAVRAARKAGRRGPRSKPKGPMGWIYDALVYRRVRSALGGRVRVLISGGAPLGLREAYFFNGAGLVLLEGYGLTETSSVATVNTPSACRIGSVGRPLPACEVRLAEDGEILVRGPTVMRGYWENETATRGAIRDGWLYTGDVGRMDRDGFLFVTDRKKDLIVTAQGKNVAPQTVEALLRGSPLIDEVVVVGDRRAFLVALVFPSLVRLRARMNLALRPGPELAAHLNAPGVRALIRAEIDRLSDTLAPHERVREFRLLSDPPSIHDGSLTPTLKVRRAEILRRYAKEIDGLYGRAQT